MYCVVPSTSLSRPSPVTRPYPVTFLSFPSPFRLPHLFLVSLPSLFIRQSPVPTPSLSCHLPVPSGFPIPSSSLYRPSSFASHPSLPCPFPVISPPLPRLHYFDDQLDCNCGKHPIHERLKNMQFFRQFVISQII